MLELSQERKSKTMQEQLSRDAVAAPLERGWGVCIYDFKSAGWIVFF